MRMMVVMMTRTPRSSFLGGLLGCRLLGLGLLGRLRLLGRLGLLGDLRLSCRRLLHRRLGSLGLGRRLLRRGLRCLGLGRRLLRLRRRRLLGHPLGRLLGRAARRDLVSNPEGPRRARALGALQESGGDGALERQLEMRVHHLGVLADVEMGADVLVDGLARRTATLLEGLDGLLDHLGVLGVVGGLLGLLGAGAGLATGLPLGSGCGLAHLCFRHDA
uniref:Uncharacterized protein n=1 Tax=Ixodes scapularis TaxID=6945 RepID=A0A4D5RXV0_IXOSC